MAVANIAALKVATNMSGGYDIPHRSDLQEAATQTYKAGAVLVLSSGTIAEGTGAAGTGITGAILGIAENDGQNLGSAGFYSGGSTVNGIFVPVVGAPNQGPLYVPALPGLIYEANLATVTAADPDQATSLALSQIGNTFAISKASTSKLWFLDATAAGNKLAVVIGLKDAVGTVAGRVYFMIKATTGNTIYA